MNPCAEMPIESVAVEVTVAGEPFLSLQATTVCFVSCTSTFKIILLPSGNLRALRVISMRFVLA